VEIDRKAMVAKLKKALEETQRFNARTEAQIIEHRSLFRESREIQAAETAHWTAIVHELSEQGKLLREEARVSWTVTRRLQSTLRSHEAVAQEQVDELGERHRKLMIENARLRKARGAMQSRLHGLRQRQRREIRADSSLAGSTRTSAAASPNEGARCTPSLGETPPSTLNRSSTGSGSPSPEQSPGSADRVHKIVAASAPVSWNAVRHGLPPSAEYVHAEHSMNPR